MSSSELWEQYKQWLLDDPDTGFRLDVSRMNLTEDSLERHAPAMQRAFDSMAELERGAIANPDEQRMVGHYWLRAPKLAPQPELTRVIEQTLERLLEFSGRVHRGEVRPQKAERFENILIIGIGGSALGPQFVAQALGGVDDRLTPYFLDNTDPDGIDRVLQGLGASVDRTLAIVISKSGGTPETRNCMLETAEVYRSRGLDFGRHAVAITQEGSKLDRFAIEREFLDRFPMWDWVGGRTSELSAVGLLPAALQGIDVRAMLQGAARMDESTRVTEARRNPAALLALAWLHEGHGRGAKDMAILPYRDRLALFSRYLQQLVMESLGKELDLDGNVVQQGIAVYGNKGSTDQHAYVQQLREGVPNFFVTFVEVLRDRDGAGMEIEPGVTAGDYLQGFLLGTRRALYDNQRRSITITIREVRPESVGALIALYERAVGLYATMVNVNAYHQPGVEAGKKAAASVLALQGEMVNALGKKGAAGATADELARSIGRPEDVETVFHLLERLAVNAERGIERVAADSAFEATYRVVDRN